MKKLYLDLLDAQAILRPRALELTGALQEPVTKWVLSHHLHAVVTEATRGHIINDIWNQEAASRLSGDKGVVPRENGGRHRKFLLFDDLIAIRVKHVDSKYRTRNYPTARASAWNAQTRFEGIPDVPRLDLGYRLDLTGTLIQDAMVQYSQDDETVWRWQVWGPSLSEFAAVPRDLLGRNIYSYDDYSGMNP